MKIAIASVDDSILPELTQKINPEYVFTSAKDDELLRLADLSLQIDEKIYLDYATFDLVTVVKNSNLDFDKVFSNNPAILTESLCMFKDDDSGSFICSPQMFSMIGNIYKIDFGRFANYPSAYKNKIMHIALTIGIKLHVF